MLLLRGGRVIDPSQKIDEILDILIKEDTIIQVGKNLESSVPKKYHPERGEGSIQIIELKGKLVTPGLIDMHVHFREPGFENRETIDSGARAAARGGLTAVCCMPNTNPPLDSAGQINFYVEKNASSPVAIYPVACVSKNRNGLELSEMASLYEAGAVAFSDDGSPVACAELARRALEYSKITKAPIINHCEEKTLTEGAVMHEGYFSSLLGLKGMPAEAEEIMISRDIALAKMTGGRVHIAHLSTEGGVELIRRAKKDGVNITCEVTINHLLLTDDALTEYDTNLKVNPPLRGKKDKAALLKALADGTIDCLVSDHAPWTREEKEVEFDLAPFGISGVDTIAALAFGELHKKHKIPLNRVIAAMSCNPAKILNLPQRAVKKGVRANLSVIDLEACQVIDKNNFLSMGKNTPYHGREVTAMPYMTVVRGKLYRDWGLGVKAVRG